jgi:cytosine/adenosine deaminase-related metal-dependent hydrolase
VGFQEHQLGTLTVGKLADVVVLGDDPLHFDPARFHHLPVDLTISGGRVVYERQAAASAQPVPAATRPMAGGCGCLH